MERIKGWVNLVFVLTAIGIPLQALLVAHVEPTALLGYALTGLLVYAAGPVVVNAIPD